LFKKKRGVERVVGTREIERPVQGGGKKKKKENGIQKDVSIQGDCAGEMVSRSSRIGPKNEASSERENELLGF